MKTISSRFLRAAISLVLVVMLLFSSTISGFAAVVDTAQTGVDHTGGYVYFLKPSTWTESTVMMFIGHDSYTSVYTMTKVSNTDNLYRYTMPSWGGATYVAFANAGSAWGSGSWGPSNRTNAPHYTNVYNNYGFNSGSYYVCVPASTSNNAGISINYKSSASALNLTTRANVYGAAAGSTTYSSNAAAGTVSVSGRYMSAYSTAAARSAVSSTSSTAYASTTLAPGSTVTFTATPATGYDFVGWSTSSSEANIVSTSTTYTYKYDISYTAKTVYALFKKAGYSYTISAGTGGTVSPSGSGTGTSVDITATPSTGYEFAGWTATNGSLADASKASTTFKPTANGATATATFAKKTYTYEFLDINGDVLDEGVIEHGETPTAPTAPAITGKTFAGWSPTVSAVTSNVSYQATYTDNTYTVSYTQEGGTGTVTLGKTSAKYGDTVTLTVTPPTNYKISSITGGGLNITDRESYSGSFTMPASNVTINVVYVKAGACDPHFEKGNQTLNLGYTVTNTASTNQYCTEGGTFTYSSNATAIATVNASGVVTAKKPGTATITATCACGTTCTYTVTVNSPTVTVANMTLDVNGVQTALPTIGNAPASGATITYSSGASYITVTSAGKVTANKPGSGGIVNYVMTYGGNQVASGSFGVTVTEPTVTITPTEVKLITGQTMGTAYVVEASYGNPTITIASDNTGVATIANGKATAVGAGSANITATFTYNSSYKPTAAATVLVTDPTITANKQSVALEYYTEDIATDSTTVTLTTNADMGNGEGDEITYSSDDEDVATVSLSGTTLTINATGIGTTNVTATFHGVDVVIPVTVTEYDPYVYLYVTDSQGWDNMFLHSWKGSNTAVTTLGNTDAQMIYIGRNGDNAKIFAYRFLKGSEPEKVIMVKSNNWSVSNTDRTDDYAVDFSAGYAALYISGTTNSAGRRETGDWTKDCLIVRPTVSVADVNVPVGSTAEATATVENGGVVYWTTGSTSIATVADVTTATSTVTGVTAGDTTITARAFIDTANASIKSLPANYKTDSTSWPFISSAATADVSVADRTYTVNTSAQYTDDGAIYVDGTTGGTASADLDKVSHGKSVKLTAEANDGYRFVGWFDGEDSVSTSAEYTISSATGEINYTARFIKTYNVEVILGEGIESVKENNTPNAADFTITVDAGGATTLLATPAKGYKFVDWTVNGSADTDGSTLAQMTVSNILSNLTITANAAPVYEATVSIFTNKVADTTGGTVTINGMEPPVEGEAGDTLTYEATPADGYSFYGWFAPTDTEFSKVLSTNASYDVEQTDTGASLVAMFYKDYVITSETDEIAFDYNFETNEYKCSIPSAIAVSPVEFTINGVTTAGTVDDGCTLVYAGDKFTYTLDTVNYYADAEHNISVTLTLNAEGKYELNATAVAKPKFAVTFAGGTKGSGTGDYAVGAPVTVQIAVDTANYLEYVSSDDADLELTVEGTTVTFTMPANDVEIKATYGDKRYIRFVDETGIKISYEPTPNGYTPSTAVAVKITPESSAYTILGDDITATPADASFNLTYDVVDNGDGTFTINIASMPDCDVYIATKYEAKFLMDYKVVTVDPNSSTATGGTVEMTANGEVIDNTVYNAQGTEVTYTATAKTDYTFVGFFSDANCKKLLSTDTEYTIVPTDNTTVYALFTRDIYIVGTVTGDWANYVPMAYDYKEGAYYYDTDVTANAAYKVTTASDKINTDIIGGSSLEINQWGANKGVTLAWSTEGNNNITYNGLAEGYDAPVRIFFQVAGERLNYHYAKATRTGATIYLSSGRLDTCGDFTSTSVFVEPDFTVSAEKSVVSAADNIPADGIVEKYYVGSMEDAHSFTIQTNLGGNNPQNHYVESYIIYYIDSQTYDVIPSTDIANMGANRYSASVMCQGDCYIVPVVYHTDAYLESQGIETYNVYFDASEGDRDYWGPFVAAYVYGEEYSPNGSWPGQLMIPNDDGTSYSLRVELNPNENFQGIVFNNYLAYSVPQTECVAFGLGSDPATLECVQTYDYKEPLYLYEEGYAAITFKMKTTTDGYHGDYVDTENETNGDVSTWNDNDNILSLVNSGALDFEPLVDRSGTQLMDLCANSIGSDLYKSPDYYIVAKGDVLIEAGKYELDNDYAGKWTVEWWIYDANTGEHITTVISGSMYDGINVDEDSKPSVLQQKMAELGHDIEDKVVNITYEFNNACADDSYYPVGTTNKDHHSDNDRFDGQWYGNLSNETMHTEIYVGLADDSAEGGYAIAADNEEYYGQAYINEVFPTYDVSYATGIVNLSATPLVGADGTVYRYDGLYIMEDGEYQRIAEAYNYSPTVTEDTVYYALFSEIGDDQLLITHQPYVNYTDTEILSHNGVSTMIVDIYAYDKETGTKGDLLASGDESIFLSQATIDITSGESYLVEVKTTPLNQGKFYAWYTDSTTDSGAATYEEIMTLGDDVNKGSMVTNSFVYTASATSQRVINIYSDVTRVTNKAMLVYRYLNRFGEWRTYTIPEIILTDDECLGYEGNNFEPYVPTYRTAYVMSNGEEDVTIYGAGDYETFTELGYKVTSSTNKIQYYAPSPKVTQAFDEEIEWKVTDVQLTYQKSLITLEATQNDPVYTVNYTIDGESDSVSGVYNTLINGEIIAPETDSAGNAFSYWLDLDTYEILSYSRFYNYRIVEDKNIEAVFGVTVGEDEWTASINSVTYTREYQDTSDYVYTDFLIDFTNTNIKTPELDDIKYSEGIEYGLIMVREANVSYDTSKTTAEQAYPMDSNISEHVKSIALAGQTDRFQAVSTDGKDSNRDYAAYCYNLTDYDTTNFNRMNYYIKYDNSVEKYRSYLWTCYAYIIEDGEVKLSEPVPVSIYECATATVK